MPIEHTVSGSADNDSIISIQVVRTPNTGDMQVRVVYSAGGSRMLNLTPSDAFRASIEATYAEIIAAINTAEGLA